MNQKYDIVSQFKVRKEKRILLLLLLFFLSIEKNSEFGVNRSFRSDKTITTTLQTRSNYLSGCLTEKIRSSKSAMGMMIR